MKTIGLILALLGSAIIGGAMGALLEETPISVATVSPRDSLIAEMRQAEQGCPDVSYEESIKIPSCVAFSKLADRLQNEYNVCLQADIAVDCDTTQPIESTKNEG